ncbi:hypothetical protein [Sphingomonas sp.]|uniref:hypothetical protein n=1 Tax=Sphingomonas sp. TaxID=28214 RepID=UPI003BAD7F0D
MTDRPIIFSAPMVRALLAGRKTQTRRLATSPLARCAVGDRLWVKETFAKAPPHGVRYAATDAISDLRRQHPSIHMPRWASRVTLIVEAVRTEPLQAISEDDAWAEGVCQAVEDAGRTAFGESCSDEMRRMIVTSIIGSGATAYRWLWESLHDKEGQRWEDNPEVLVLTFSVRHGNIDRIVA